LPCENIKVKIVSMTLTTHAIAGAAIASVLPSHPILGFTVGFASHFLLDSIPHWDYSLRSTKKDPNNSMNDDMVINKNFVFDLFKIGFDVALGLIIVLFLFGISNFHLVWMPIWGAIGAITPDALQFVYFKWRHEPFVSLQRFHIGIQRNKQLNNYPVLGILLQTIVIVFLVVVSKLFAS
jgi:hypothetical protein